MHAKVGGQRDPAGNRPRGEGRRGARHHGPQRLRQEHPGPRPGRSRGLRSHGGQKSSTRAGPARMEPGERAREGLFLAFQYPVEIPGVSNAYFLKAALNAVRKHRGEEELDAIDFLNPGQGEDEARRCSTKFLLERGPSTRASPAARRSATRSSRWPSSTRARGPRRDRLRPRHRRASARGRRRQRGCAAPSAP